MTLSNLLLTFCQWADNSFFGHGVRNSTWLFPFVEIFHLLALGVLGGSVLIVNARLLGLRFQQEPVSELAAEVETLDDRKPDRYVDFRIFSVLFRIGEDVWERSLPHQNGVSRAGHTFFVYGSPQGDDVRRRQDSSRRREAIRIDFDFLMGRRRNRWAGHWHRLAVYSAGEDRLGFCLPGAQLWMRPEIQLSASSLSVDGA